MILMKKKNIFTRLATLALATALAATLVVPAMAADSADDKEPGTGYSVVIDGKDINAVGAVMVPARAVAEALGFTVTWLGNGQFTLDNGEMQTTVTLGEDSYLVVPGVEGVAGAALISLGVPPFCVNGVSYVPLTLLEALCGNREGMITISDNQIRIETDAKTSNILIVTLTPEATAETAQALFAQYQLEVVYAYQNLGNMYAVKPGSPLSKAEIESLIAALAGEESILAVEKDSTVYALDEEETIDGGWTRAASPVVTDEIKALLDKALDGMAGADWKPVALLGSQVVAGMNYCILCEITPVYPNAESHYMLAYVYAGLDGSAALREAVDFDVKGADGKMTTQIANPFADYATLADAEKAAGFEMKAPDTVAGYDGETAFQVMSGRMLQMIYFDSQDNRLFIRKEAGSEDISGDYNSYAEIQTVGVAGREVTMKGENGLVSVAIWTDGAYTYAVTTDKPMAQDAMTALISAVA